MDLTRLMQAALGIAQEAGDKILDVYENNTADTLEVSKKVDNSPVTAADIAAHHHIVDSLNHITPYPVLSEESADIPFSERQKWSTYWLVDPLDGTKEFIKRNGEFSVLIALIHEHEPILGVVHAPTQDCSWFACIGSGAYKQDGDMVIPIQTRDIPDTPVVYGSRSANRTAMPDFLKKLGNHEYKICGSAIKACYVAEGSADVYPRFWPTSEWDTAAAQIIVEEAGGQMTYTDMTPMRYNTKDSLLNPHFLVFGRDSLNWAEYLPKESQA